MTDENLRIIEIRIRDKANKLKALLHNDPKFKPLTINSLRNSFDTLLTKDIDLPNFKGLVKYREFYNSDVNPELDYGTKTDLYIFGKNKDMPVHFTEGDSSIAMNTFKEESDLIILEESIDSILNSLKV